MVGSKKLVSMLNVKTFLDEIGKLVPDYRIKRSDLKKVAAKVQGGHNQQHYRKH